MVTSVLVLAVSTALFCFYIQTICEKALKREFSHPYFQDIAKAIKLESPRLRDSFASKTSYSYPDARLALKCDFMTLEYLLKNGAPSCRRLSRSERILVLYFRFLLFSLSIRHAFRLREREVVSKLATILQFFANSVGEKLSISSLAKAQANLKS
jgi:hypothetical protein